MSPRPSERLGAVDVEDDAGVGLAGDGEGDARGDVRLDHARDDVGRGALGGDHQVDADGSGLLRQADDVLLHLLRRHHHQVGQLVDDHRMYGSGRSPRRARALFMSARLRECSSSMSS